MLKPAAHALLLATALTAQAQDAPGPEAPPAEVAPAPPVVPAGPAVNRVAVVVGISQYANLPGRVMLPSAKDNAGAIAQTLKDKAHFNHVFLLTDAQASRDNITTLLQREVANLVGPNDVFMLYFEGHGVGADFGLPTLLAYDSTMENGQEDGFDVSAFSRDLQSWIHAGSTLIVTDVVHEQQVEGVSFFGPSAPHWPRMQPGTMVLSATQAEAPAKEGAFGALFDKAMSGEADVDYDHVMTMSELYSWLVSQMAVTGQIPVASGDFDGHAVIATGLATQAPVAAAPTASVAPGLDSPIIDVTASFAGTGPRPAPQPQLFPDIAIPAVKFVFHDGGSQSVQCHGSDLKACDPSCYVRYFRSGVCTVSAVIDGIQRSGQVIVLSKGKYDCRDRGNEIVCDGPYL